MSRRTMLYQPGML